MIKIIFRNYLTSDILLKTNWEHRVRCIREHICELKKMNDGRKSHDSINANVVFTSALSAKMQIYSVFLVIFFPSFCSFEFSSHVYCIRVKCREIQTAKNYQESKKRAVINVTHAPCQLNKRKIICLINIRVVRVSMFIYVCNMFTWVRAHRHLHWSYCSMCVWEMSFAICIQSAMPDEMACDSSLV